MAFIGQGAIAARPISVIASATIRMERPRYGCRYESAQENSDMCQAPSAG